MSHVVKLKNAETNRYVFCQAEKNQQEGSEGGWIGAKTQEKPLIGADANYYNRAMWEVEKRGDAVLLRNHESKRLVFDQGEKLVGERGAEGGWIGAKTKKALSADANYYNLALWKVQNNSNGTVSLINQETNRMLFDTSDKFVGNAGAEGGWIGANIKPIVTADANYYNRAMWFVEGPALPASQQTNTGTTTQANSSRVVSGDLLIQTGKWNSTEKFAWNAPREGMSSFLSDKIPFPEHYSAAPIVHVSLSSVDSDHGHNLRLNVESVEVDSSGFKVKIGWWADSHIYSAAVSWIAFGNRKITRDLPMM